MMAKPYRETARLRFGRTNSEGASYFVTACTKNRDPILTGADNGMRIEGTLRAMHSAGDINLTAATVMPDHVHLLFVLGARLDVGQVMGKFKTWSRDMGKASWRWQQDGFEHRLRQIESVEDYGFYIFMNPYRAGLCRLGASWPWWLCPDPSTFRFLAALEGQQEVPPTWLGLSDKIEAKIITGD